MYVCITLYVVQKRINEWMDNFESMVYQMWRIFGENNIISGFSVFVALLREFANVDIIFPWLYTENNVAWNNYLLPA